LLAVASIAAFFVNPGWVIDRITRLLGEFLPRGEMEIAGIVKDAIGARGGVSLISIAILIWTGSRVFAAMTQALNIAYQAQESHGFVKRTLLRLFMPVVIGVLLVAALASRTVLYLVWVQLNLLAPIDERLLEVLLGTIQTGLLLATFFLIYRFVPRPRVAGRAALGGSVLATLLFLGARPLFLSYVEQFANYNLIYGSLTLIIILMLWAWVVAMILLIGGELAWHVQTMLIDPSLWPAPDLPPGEQTPDPFPTEEANQD
jgi:membrane protein